MRLLYYNVAIIYSEIYVPQMSQLFIHCFSLNIIILFVDLGRRVLLHQVWHAVECIVAPALVLEAAQGLGEGHTHL